MWPERWWLTIWLPVATWWCVVVVRTTTWSASLEPGLAVAKECRVDLALHFLHECNIRTNLGRVDGEVDRRAPRDSIARRVGRHPGRSRRGIGPTGGAASSCRGRCGAIQPDIVGGVGRLGLSGPGRRGGVRLLSRRISPRSRRPPFYGLEGVGHGALGPRGKSPISPLSRW